MMKKPFRSFLAIQMEEFVYSRRAAGKWNASYDANLHSFDNYCADRYPNASALTEAMLGWCCERPTENGNTCKNRISAVSNFVKYARGKGWTDIAPPQTPAPRPCTFVPHAFTKEELTLFFRICDRHVTERFNRRSSAIVSKLNKLELPVYYRLLFSTGMRTNEARWLKRSDVDLIEGVININRSKGVDRHRVAIHASMLRLLEIYDEKMAKLMPARTCFFPDRNDCFHSAKWAEYHFRIIWNEISKEHARPYDFRSHYAVTNVTGWKDNGFEVNDKLLYLSRTMGHRSVNSTCGYFHLTPVLADKIKTLTEESFNNLLPKLSDYDEQEK